ncbi:MAG: hypothetical protein Q7S26_02225 [bacterium]|nr:hypothetical protein [bacterium]
MSTAIKWVIAIIIIAGGAWLLWWSGWLGGIQQPAPESTTTAPAEATSNTPPTLNGMSSASDTSDVAVAQDIAAVDSQMQGLVSDSASVDASVSDTPVTQSY